MVALKFKGSHKKFSQVVVIGFKQNGLYNHNVIANDPYMTPWLENHRAQ